MNVRQWSADWWVTCAGPCDQQILVDGNTSKKRYATLRRDGWRRVAGKGWHCPECAKGYSGE